MTVSLRTHGEGDHRAGHESWCKSIDLGQGECGGEGRAGAGVPVSCSVTVGSGAITFVKSG